MPDTKIDPSEIVVMPDGGIFYNGRDIRNTLKSTADTELSGVNVACINSSSCKTINIQCDNLDLSEGGVNVGLCRNGV